MKNKLNVINLIFVILTIIICVFYCFVLYAIFSYTPTYEYNMHYKLMKTRFWAGDGSMTINIDKVMNFDYSSTGVILDESKVVDVDLQFVGKNVETVKENGVMVAVKNNLEIFWQWDSSVIEDDYINIYITFNDTVDSVVNINGQEQTFQEKNIMLPHVKYSKENCLTIDGENVELTQIRFDYEN